MKYDDIRPNNESCNIYMQAKSKFLFRYCLLWKQNGMDIWKNTSGSNRDTTQKFVQLFIILDGEGKVAWYNSAFLVVTSGISGKFQDLSTEVLQHGSHVNRCPGANA